VKAVVFDVGETLADETPYWSSVADRLGIPRFTFLGVLGGVIARGEHHHQAFELLGVERVEGERRLELYPDALPCLRRLREAGYEVGIAANQPDWAKAALREAGVELTVVATSAEWGVEKPSPDFFARLVEVVGRPAAEIAYVGDRVDNDVRPARAAGMVAVHIRRGPWGYLQDGADGAYVRLDSLDELPEALARV
jgi:HAD superfamily hydrolase (TIGR01662 family)